MSGSYECGLAHSDVANMHAAVSFSSDPCLDHLKLESLEVKASTLDAMVVTTQGVQPYAFPYSVHDAVGILQSEALKIPTHFSCPDVVIH